MSEGERRPPDVPYATPSTGRGEAGGWIGLVPLLSGFGLLGLGLLAMLASIPSGEADYQLEEAIEMLSVALFIVGLIVGVFGFVVVFRALRKYDW